MFSENSRKLYRRLLVLGLLVACLGVFTSSEASRKVLAAACQQDCDSLQAACFDACAEECSVDDPNCNGCITNCHADWRSCSRHSVWCDGETVSNGRCTVGYADHCPVNPNTGVANCSDPSAHSGYFEICENIGGGQCVSCPDHEFCTGSGGIGPCF